MILEVDVTHEHIEAGKACIARECPVAIAINAALRKAGHNGYALVSASRIDIASLGGDTYEYTYEVPSRVKHFIWNYDDVARGYADPSNARFAKPFSFTLITQKPEAHHARGKA